MIVVDHTNCNCGAVTLHFEDGQTNSIHKDNLKAWGVVTLF